MKRIAVLCIVFLLPLALLAGCAADSGGEPHQTDLPPAQPATDDMFGVDVNINQSNIDDYLGRDDVAYRDIRMLFDPADYAAIGGEADLTRTIEGFKVVPFPYIGTLGDLPVDGAYDGPALFDVEWAPDGTVLTMAPRYEESRMIIDELFPQDKAIFLMCGGAGYSGMMRQMLIHLGWNESKIYNIGGNWEYQGEHRLELVVHPEKADGDPIYATWRADYAYIDFDKLQELP